MVEQGRHRAARPPDPLSQQGLWPVAASQGPGSFYAICLPFLFPIIPPEDEDRSDAGHRLLGASV